MSEAAVSILVVTLLLVVFLLAAIGLRPEKPFHPTDIPGLVYWFDAETDEGVFTGGQFYILAVYDRGVTRGEMEALDKYLMKRAKEARR